MTLPAAFDYRHYVPILLTRQGERLAMRELSEATKSRLTPLFVVHPVDRDLDTGQPKKSTTEHSQQIATQLARDWGTSPAFIDARFLETPEEDGHHHPLTVLTECASDSGLLLSPVVSTFSDESTIEAASNALGDDLHPCFRLSPEEWAGFGTPAGDGRLIDLLARCAVSPNRVHIVLDGGELASSPALTAAALRGAIASIPHASEWASLTVAGTGMPSGTADVGRDNTSELPRVEWRVWRQLLEGSGGRTPTFGDYGVQHPDPVSDFDPRFMDSSAQLRYTIPSAWFVARGRGVKASGNAQIRRLAQQVVDHPEFAGEDFSWGDKWLVDCASGSCSAGNQGLWRKVTTNHHLTYVVSQIASLLGP